MVSATRSIGGINLRMQRPANCQPLSNKSFSIENLQSPIANTLILTQKYVAPDRRAPFTSS
ncbi:hypothetical protein [Tychonema sp. LEGE 07203]|uniref:hypothetical protein n=1 Tax=Tychonema sp. LEGE 07203 TaxID=1828671 RepID=UPI0018830A6D|nr:hypothetical protein [Tychonema sp. LEGE 07203]